MTRFDTETEIDGKKYTLYDEQFREVNAEFSKEILERRIPNCGAIIRNLEGTEWWAVYVPLDEE